MIEATSCGGVVIFRGKILVLYKNYKNKYEGWVLPKGTVEAGEEYRDTALREVKEETGVSASIIKYIGKSQYSFNTPQDMVEKDVHWYLMMADSYYSKPQREEHFVDSGYYKFYEAYHLLKFSNEKQILEQRRQKEAGADTDKRNGNQQRELVFRVRSYKRILNVHDCSLQTALLYFSLRFCHTIFQAALTRHE